MPQQPFASPAFWRRLELGLLGLWIFLIPSNLFLRLCDHCGYVQGLLSDYLIPKIYLLDVVSIFLLVLASFEIGASRPKISALKSQLSHHWPLAASTIGLWLAIGSQQFFSQFPLIGIISWLRWSAYVVIGWLLWRLARLEPAVGKVIPLVLASTLWFQGLLATWQWLTQQSLAGYWFLGEATLSRAAGLATTTLSSGQQLILPYGTTAHPNVLGGLAALWTVWLVKAIRSRTQVPAGEGNRIIPALEKLLISLAVGWGIALVILTQSAAASLVFVVAGFWWLSGDFFEKPQLVLTDQWLHYLHLIVIAGLISAWLSSAVFTYQTGILRPETPSWYRRAYLLESSTQLVLEKPIQGTGLGQFTALAPQSLRPFESARFNQPVHHGVALWLSESGLLGAAMLLLLLLILASLKLPEIERRRALKSLFPLVALTPLLIWDHYLVSLASGTAGMIAVWVGSNSITKKGKQCLKF